MANDEEEDDQLKNMGEKKDSIIGLFQMNVSAQGWRIPGLIR